MQGSSEAELGAPAAGPAAPVKEALKLSWGGEEVLRRSNLGQGQAIGPQPSGTSTTQSNLLSASRIPVHTASSLAERTPPLPSLCPGAAPASAKPNIPHVEQQGDTLVDVSPSRPFPSFLAQCPAPHVAGAQEMAVEYTTAPPKRQGVPSFGRGPANI